MDLFAYLRRCKVAATTRCRIMLRKLRLRVRILKNRTNRRALFVDRPTNRTSVAQGLLRWVWTQCRRLDTPGGSKNVSDPVGISLKRGATGAKR